MAPELVLALGLAAIFLSALLAFASVTLGEGDRKAVSRSLAALQALEAAPASMRRELDKPFAERVVFPAAGSLTALGRRLAPRGQLDRLRRHLTAAGNPRGWDVDRLLAVKMLAAMAGGVLGIVAPLLLRASPLTVIGLAAVLTVVGFLFPDLVLLNAVQRRAQSVREDLPDALDLLTISVEAGLAFDAALAQVARNTPGPLGQELYRVLQEMQIGLSRASALRALSERLDLPELRGVVSAMVQADELGVPVAAVLRVQARGMRTKRSQLAEEKAQKLPVKILFPLIFCIMPCLFGIVIGPAVLGVVRDVIG